MFILLLLFVWSTQAAIVPVWNVHADGNVGIRPTPRFGHALWSLENGTATDSLFLGGGITGFKNISEEYWRYSASLKQWTLVRNVAGAGNPNRAFQQLQWTPLGLVVEGGLTIDDVTHNYLSNQIDVVTWDPMVFNFLPGGENFISSTPPTRLIGQSMSYANGHLYIFGGYPCAVTCTTEDSDPVNDYIGQHPLYATYDVSLNPTTGFVFNVNLQGVLEGYAHHTATVVGQVIWVLGGKTVDLFGDPYIAHYRYSASAGNPYYGTSASVQSYDIQGNTWTDWLPNIHFSRWGHTATLFDGLIYIFGGQAGAEVANFNPYLNDLLTFDPASVTFQVWPTTQAPAVRAFHNTVLTQFAPGCFTLAVFGGTDSPVIEGVHARNSEVTIFTQSISGANFLGDFNLLALQGPNITHFIGCVAAFPNVVDCLPTGNNPLTIIGVNLNISATTTITIGGDACVITTITDSKIVCILPPVPAGPPDLVLTASCGGVVLTYTDAVRYAAPCSAAIAPSPRWGALMWGAPNTTLVDDAFFIYGGMTPTGDLPISQEVWIFRLLTGCWTQLRSDIACTSCGAFPDRAFAAGAHTPSGFVIIGGHTSDPNNVVVNEIDVVTWFPLVYDLSRANVVLAANPPNALFGHTLTYFNGSLFIIGGWTCLGSPCTAIQQFPETNINAASNFTSFDFGTSLADFTGNNQVGFHTSTVLHNKIYVYGGVIGSATNAVTNNLWEFDTYLHTLTLVTTSGATAPQLWGHNTAAFDGLLYIFGGRAPPTPEAYQNGLYTIDAGNTNTVKVLFANGGDSIVPTARGFHSMLVMQIQPTCNMLVIYGGTTSTAFNSSDNHLTPGRILTNFGNVQSALGDIGLVLLNPPNVTSFDGCTPAFPDIIECPPAGNVPITIIGTNLGYPNTSISIGGKDCPIISQSDTEIQCTLPPVSHGAALNPDLVLTACGLPQLAFINATRYSSNCAVNPCEFGGTCTPNGPTNFTCSCLFGLSGPTCNEPVSVAIFGRSV